MNRLRAWFLAGLASVSIASASLAGEAPPSDEVLFGDALTPERGEALRLAAKLEPHGWPTLREMAHDVAAIRRPDAAMMSKIAKIDETIGGLAERLTPEVRRAPLDALENLARAELRMLKAVESVAPRRCAGYLWSNPGSRFELRRAARAQGREAELARLRTIVAARAFGAINPAYYVEWISEEQEQLRDAGLSRTDIAIAFSGVRPPGIDAPTLCRAAIGYLSATLDYPATLRAKVLAFRLSGDFGYGAEGED